MRLTSFNQTLIAGCIVLALAACQPQAKDDGKQAAPAPTAQANNSHQVVVGAPEGTMVAEVNGEKITQPMLEVFAKARGMDVAVPAQREAALQSIIETTLLAQDAIKNGMMDDPLVRSEVALARIQQLAGRRMHAMGETTKATDAEIKAEYDAEVAKAGDKEFHFQQLQFADEAKAKEALAEAQKKGAKFEKLIEKYRQGEGFNANDYGFINITQIAPLPEVAEVLLNLKDGETAATLVKSRAGYHVVRRVASRAYQPPKFEEVKQMAADSVVKRKIAEAVKNLRANADVVTP